MVSASVDPVESGAPPVGAWRLVVAIAAPLALLALATGLWTISDQAISIGPLDRATFGWLFIAPIWLSAPVVAGFLWKSMTRIQIRLAALVICVVISTAAALEYWQSIGTPFDCGFGIVTPPIDFLPQTLFVGLIVGGSLALDALLVATLARLGVRWWAVVIGAGTEVILLGFAFFAIFATWGAHTCFVPGPNYPVTP